MAGPENRRFLVNKSFLNQSPVFEAMTEGPFREGVTRVIHLEDDDAALIFYTIRFLCTGDFQTVGRYDLQHPNTNSSTQSSIAARGEMDISDMKDDDTTSSIDEEDDANNQQVVTTSIYENEVGLPDNADQDGFQCEDWEAINPREAIAAEELARLCIMANKFQLPKLKSLTLEKLRTCLNIYGNPAAFFRNLVAELRTWIPDSDDDINWWVEVRGMELTGEIYDPVNFTEPGKDADASWNTPSVWSTSQEIA